MLVPPLISAVRIQTAPDVEINKIPGLYIDAARGFQKGPGHCTTPSLL